MSKKSTVNAARAEMARGGGDPDDPNVTQGHLADRHVRTHTPGHLYGTGDDGEQTEE
ncbi:hypothetical protein [Streptomyces albus]|uniref:hypothetical protein n=1 Tax=Streptomyces sp. NRRL F-5917 TaxID=1463873 RepID=UPI0013315DF1|nr:hypothetical protein [Streptomyces sp. NRRL F-5917]